MDTRGVGGSPSPSPMHVEVECSSRFPSTPTPNGASRLDTFVGEKLYDLLVIAQANAKANSRDVLQPSDLPVTKGLQERIHEFQKLDEEIDLQPILLQLAKWPLLDVTVSEETESRLPALVGGLSVALARTFRVLDPDLKNPQTKHWDRSSALMSMLP